MAKGFDFFNVGLYEGDKAMQIEAVQDTEHCFDAEYARHQNVHDYGHWCLKSSTSTYVLSQVGLPSKQPLGARQIPLRTMTRNRNPLINRFASRLA